MRSTLFWLNASGCIERAGIVMFDRFRGSLAATKFTNRVCNTCRDLVNMLIANGYRLKLHDTVFVFSECYSAHLFTYRKKYKSDSAAKRANMMLLAHQYMTKWLMKIFSNAGPGIDFESTARDVIEGLPSYFENWEREVEEKITAAEAVARSDFKAVTTTHCLSNLTYYINEKIEKSEDRKNIDSLLTGVLSTHLGAL